MNNLKLKGVGLSCQGSQCLCPTGSLWFWSPYSNKCVQCPAGWSIYTDRCYYYTTQLVTWSEARDACKSYGGYLIIVDDNTEYNRLITFYKETNLFSVWVLNLIFYII